jgi:hypothetical protein
MIIVIKYYLVPTPEYFGTDLYKNTPRGINNYNNCLIVFHFFTKILTCEEEEGLQKVSFLLMHQDDLVI